MIRLIRTWLVAALALPATLALAQTPPFPVTVYGTVSGCTPTSTVHIVSVQNTQPAIDITVPVDPQTCTYSTLIDMISPQGWFLVSTMCMGANQSQSATYEVNTFFPDSTLVNVSFNCGGGADPCEACMQVDQVAPFIGMFTSCSSGGVTPYELLWDFSFAGAVPGGTVTMEVPGPGVYTVCLNLTSSDACSSSICEEIYVDADGNISMDPPAGCEACFTVSPVMNGNNPVPFQANFTNCSTGSPVFDYQWWLPNGQISTQEDQTFTFPEAGVYGVCLTINDGMGCNATLCDTVVVDPNGGINTIPAWYDCMGVLWGPNTAGTPCNNPATGEGTWNANCECVPNTTTCQACIELGPVINPNGNAIPFAVLGTNCSQGTAPITYQIDWGDGVVNSSSDHAYNAPGLYLVCITITDGAACTSTACDSVYVDANGNIGVDPPTSCSACIQPVQSQQGGALLPYVVDYTSCSTGNGTLTYQWFTPSGNLITAPGFTWQFGQDPGPHIVCLMITDATGCASTACDTLMFDSLGYITNEPVWYDCLSIPWGPNTPGTACSLDGGITFEGTWNTNCECAPDSGVVDCLNIPNGPNMPGTPCNNPATGEGTWNANCECVPNTPGDCEAGFWVMQAYQNGDTLGGEPIPNTLWVWNLSSGGSGLYQFLWNFGDGTTSTEPFPTHVYAGTGPYLLCLTVNDSEGCTDTYCDSVSVDENGIYNGMVVGGGNLKSVLTINVIESIGTTVEEAPAFEAIELWPNPVNDLLSISFGSTRQGNVTLSVMDAAGRTVMAGQQAMVAGTNRAALNTHALDAGIYLLRIGDGNNMITRRFVKAR